MATPFDAALEALRERRDRLTAELRRVTRLISDLEIETNVGAQPVVVAAVGSAVGSASVHASSVETPTEPPRLDAPVVVYPNELARMSYAEAARAVLRRGRRPLTTREIETLLKTGGKPVQGRDPYRMLYRTLMNHSGFTSVNGEWTLTEWEAGGEDLLTGT